MSLVANKFGKDEMWKKHNDIISTEGIFHTFVCQKSVCQILHPIYIRIISFNGT